MEDKEESEREEDEAEKKIALEAIFEAHGKIHIFSPKSVWLLAHGNPVRSGIVWIITHKRFD
jgi:hypothetical protein